MKAKVVIIPIYQKHWLYHAWSEATAAEAAAERSLHWTQGTDIQEKASILQKEIGQKINGAVQRQWKSLQTSDEGTFKNRLYRLAQWVLSQEDPTETFLKSLPRHASCLEVVHPSSLPDRIVRRRLRRLAFVQENFHHRRILGWTLATLPQLPLVLTPFPNVTLYFTAYKMVSHYQALQGCRTLRSAFDRYDVEEAQRLAAAAASQRHHGTGGSLWRRLPLPRWPRGGGTVAREVPSLKGREATAPSSSSASPSKPPYAAAAAAAAASSAPLPVFLGSRSLDSAVRPLDRWHTPLSEERALQVRDLLLKSLVGDKGGSSPPTASAATRGKDRSNGGSGGNKGAGEGDAGREGGADDGNEDGGGGVEAIPELVERLRRRVLQSAEKESGRVRRAP